jgi:hypothetical protein
MHGGASMAENKGTHLREDSTRQDFPEVKGKIIESVEITVEPDRYAISVHCQDKTSLTFMIESCVFTFPVHEDWTSGEAKILKKYQPIRSEISKD